MAGRGTLQRSNAVSYRDSLHRLLAYVGLEHYGTDAAHMPLRSPEEQRAIDVHYPEAVMEHEAHVASLQARGHIRHKQPKRSVEEAMESCIKAAAATRAGLEREGKEGISAPSWPPHAPTIFMSFEESIEWKAYLRSVPAGQRHQATVRRTLSIALWTAHQKQLCLYCWLPRAVCVCDALDSYAAALQKAWGLASDARASGAASLSLSAAPPVRTTLLLHPEELLRGTNTGHVVAHIMDAPLRVWGVPEDDAYLAALVPVSTETPQEKGEEAAAWHHVALYPATGAPTFEQFVSDHLQGPPPPPPRQDQNVSDGSGASSSPAPTPLSVPARATDSMADAPPSSSTHEPRRVHLVLLDSTWSQALSLNRHIPRWIPRVALRIDDTYKAMFAALRKRTRSSGVSTLEATSMAVHQCLEALGHPAAAAASTSCFTAAMQSYVNVKCIMKCADAPFLPHNAASSALQAGQSESSPPTGHTRVERIGTGQTPDSSAAADLDVAHSAADLESVRLRRDEARREMDQQRYAATQERVHCERGELRHLLLPPVLNYCYLCDRVIGWHRMAEHIQGQAHRRLLQKKMAQAAAAGGEEETFRIVPSAFSRTVEVKSFERPRRRDEGGAEERTKEKEGEAREP